MSPPPVQYDDPSMPNPRLRAVSEPAPSPSHPGSYSELDLYAGLQDGSVASVVFGPDSKSVMEVASDAEVTSEREAGPASPSAGPVSVPDGGFGWAVVMACALMHLLVGGLNRGYGAVYIEVRERFESSAALTAAVGGTAIATRMIGSPIGSALANRFSARAVIMVGGIFMAAGCILSGFATNTYFLLFSYGILAGVGGLLVYAPSLVLVGQYFNRRRGIALGLATAGSGIGIFCSPPFITFLFDRYGFAGAWLLLGGCLLHMVVSGALHRPLTVTRRKVDKHQDNDQLDHTSPPGPDAAVQDSSGSGLSLAEEQSAHSGESEPHWDDYGFDSSFKHNSLPPVNTDPGVVSSSDSEHEAGHDGPKQSGRGKRRPICRSVPKGHKFSEKERVSVVLEGNGKLPHESQGSVNNSPLCGASNNVAKNKVKRGCSPYMDFTLLCDCVFVAFALAQLLAVLSLITNDMLLPDLGRSLGFAKSQAILLLSVLGGADCIGRILGGFFCDIAVISPYRHHVYNAGLLLQGVMGLAWPHIGSWSGMMVVAVLYGVTVGTVTGQRTNMAVHLLGIERLSSSFALMVCFQGVGVLLGTYFGGLLRDKTSNYTASYTFSGLAALAASGLFSLAIWLRAKNRKRTKDVEKR